jgi:precorrin-3B synthase
VTYNPGVSGTSPFTSRVPDDRCPGALRLIEAADGMLARVRLPGGLVSPAQLRVLARLAGEFGDGRVELTSRGNVQLRGLAADAANPLASGLIGAGLLPSLSHDRVRNVLASPLAGLDRGPDLTGLVRALDAGLCARPRLAELPGRFLFAVDDGRGDVAGAGADVVATVRPSGAVVNGLAVRAGSRAGLRGKDGPAARTGPGGTAARGVSDDLRDAVVTAMLAHAEAFLGLRAELGSTAWRIADLPDGAERVRASAAARLGLAGARPGTAAPAAGAVTSRPSAAGQEPGAAPAGRPVGLVVPGETDGDAEPACELSFFDVDSHVHRYGEAKKESSSVRDNPDVSAVLLAPLGRLTAAQLTWVADRLGEREARITPWRSVVLPCLADAARVLGEAARLGFGTDQGSPWLRVTACAGRPGCASALADVQADAAGFAARWPGRIVHVSGCGRHCGRPAAAGVDVTATSEGYQVSGV